MLIYAQILGTQTMDIDPCILLFFENKRYLFNIGESLMRFCNEHKIRLAKISNFFLSSIQHETIGGLPGLLMTMDDFGKHHISITGPKNLTNYIQSLRFCLLRYY
jgi:ribonuclease Z